MDSKNIKIRVNLNLREFEVEGDQDSVFKNFGDLLKDYLEIIKKHPHKNQEVEKKVSQNSSTKNDIRKDELEIDALPDSFGEFYNRFPKSLSNVDKLLIACFYIQSNSEQKSFTVKDANDILVEQGIKLSNANAFNKANSETKRIFKLNGKNYRVSDLGGETIKSLLQNS